VIPGKAPLGPDEAVSIAREAAAGALVTNVSVPDAKGVYRLAAKYPEDRSPVGRTRIVVDQYSGAVLDVISTREAGAGTKLLNMKRTLHTGDVLGWPSRVVVFLGSLMLAGQVVTGFLIWWKPGSLPFGRPERWVPLGDGAAAMG
jgi:uncharacterized iron-regulated membrane protein